MGCLSFRDIENLKSHFPDENPSGRPNWAIAGGGAVMCLLEAPSIDGLDTPYGNPDPDQRGHKDMDVAVFSPHAAKLKIVYPHELYRCEFFRKPRRCNYREQEANPTGFYFELFTDYHFGFVPPSAADAVRCRCGEGSVWSLCPEYVIASRIFGLAPIRPGVDDRDIDALGRRFHLDPARLDAYVARSHYSFLRPDVTAHIVLKQEYGLLNQATLEELAPRYPRLLPVFPADAGYLLLRLKDSPLDERTLLEAHELAVEKLGHSRYSPASAWATAFCLCTGVGDEELVSQLDTLSYEIYRHDALFLRLGAQFLEGMSGLETALTKAHCNGLYRKLVPRLARYFIKTPFKQVILSVLPLQAKRLAGCTCSEEVMERMDLLGNLIASPKVWRRLA